MENEIKWVMALIVFFLGMPLVGYGYGEFRKQDCRMEMARLDKGVEDIKEICQ